MGKSGQIIITKYEIKGNSKQINTNGKTWDKISSRYLPLGLKMIKTGRTMNSNNNNFSRRGSYTNFTP